MFRRGIMIPALLAVLPVAAAAWVLSPTFFHDDPANQPGAQARAPQVAALTTPELDALMPREGTAERGPALDVARISPDGWSVFAGTAPPKATVTVTADGEPVGTAKADEHGEWTLLSDYRFSNPDPDLGLTARTVDEPRLADRREDEAAGKAAAEAAAQLAPPARMLREFEDLVATARRPDDRAEPHAAVRAPVPVPIQFVFRKAVLTDEGRRAADLLSEYLSLKRPESIVLTGHADERGHEAFNVALSRRRLETVAAHLRENGYQGRLVLVPKGSSEPYQGVDRTTVDRRILWQLDRRVELDLGSEIPRRRSVQDSQRSIPR